MNVNHYKSPFISYYMNYIYIQYWHTCACSWFIFSFLSNYWPVAGNSRASMTFLYMFIFIHLKLVFFSFQWSVPRTVDQFVFRKCVPFLQLDIYSIFHEAVPQIVVRPHATISGELYVIRIIYRFFPGICATRRGPSSDCRLCLVASVRTTTWSDAAIEYLVWWTTILV
jgi:hypothetical protein